MRRIVVPLLLLSLVGACSQISSSRLNPTNWLRAQEGPPSLIPEENMILGITKREYAGTPIYQIAELDPTSDGKILVVTAYATRAGAANAEFEAVETAPAGELHFVLNAEVDVRMPVGSPTNRQLTAGKFLSTGTLDGIRKIVIIGETNSLRRSNWSRGYCGNKTPRACMLAQWDWAFSTSTLVIFQCDTAKSRCHSALRGSCWDRVRAISNPSS